MEIDKKDSRMKTENSLEDTRRFSIYFKINDHDPIQISDLKLQQYLKLKNNIYSLEYCQSRFTDEGELINSFFRSLDDVDYEPVKVSQGAQATQNLSFALGKRAEKFNDDLELENIINVENIAILENNDTISPSTSTSNSDSDKIDQFNLIEKKLKKLQSSVIWTHVQKMGKNQDMLKCLHCLKQFKNCGNTTNMMKHLENQHPLLFERRNKSSEPTNVVARRVNDEKLEEITNTLSKRKRKSIGSSHSIVDAFKKVEAFKDGGVEADKITNTILFFICKDLMSLSVIDNEGFTLLLKILVPLYQTPSRKTITTKLELRYEILKNRIVNQLKTLNYYCLTCDKWSDCTNKTYIGMTVHYTDNNNLMSRCLGCIPVYDRQTTENLKVEILQILNVSELKIEKITAFVTDGETALKKAVQELVGKDKHLWCVAHILALLIPDRLTNLSILTSIIDKVKSIVTFIKRSNVASNKLQQLQINMGKSEGTSLNLLQDVSSRWTTKVNMIERYLELEELVYLTLSFAAYDAEKFLTREETQILIDILPLMKTVTSVITEISVETYPTCSIIIPIIHCMKKAIENQEANTDVGIQFKNNLLYAISNRFKGFEKSSILSMSTIADPRFKKVHFTDRLAVHSALKRIDLQVKNLTVSENTSTEEVKEKINSVWEFHDQLELVNNVHQNESSYCLEIEQYLELKRISRKSNIFEYWMKVAPAFPRMSKIAIRLLSILATTVPSERLFSKAGLIKVDHRNRLTAQHLNMLLFLSSLPRNDWDI